MQQADLTPLEHDLAHSRTGACTSRPSASASPLPLDPAPAEIAPPTRPC